MMRSTLRFCQTLLAAAVVLSVPAYAVCSLQHGAASRPGNVVLSDSDDPISNGLRIVDLPLPARPQEAAVKAGADKDVLLLTDWTYTDKSKPSAYN